MLTSPLLINKIFAKVSRLILLVPAAGLEPARLVDDRF